MLGDELETTTVYLTCKGAVVPQKRRVDEAGNRKWPCPATRCWKYATIHLLLLAADKPEKNQDTSSRIVFFVACDLQSGVELVARS